MARILLTGAAGFVGRNLLGSEGASAHEWTALDLGFPAGWPGRAPVTESVQTDMSDVAVLAEVMERFRPEVVVHLAGWTGKGGTTENRSALLAANLASTWNLLDAVERTTPRDARPVQFVLASSALVYGAQKGPFLETMETRPSDEYSLTKWLAEEAVRAYGRKGVVLPAVLRPAVIYGPGQKGSMFVPSLVGALARGERFPMTGGAQKRDLVHVRDVASAILAVVVRRAAGVFNVGSGAGIPMIDVGRKLAALAGRPDLLGVGELAYRDNEVWDYAVSAAALERATGWTPRVGLDEGLQETLDKEKNP